MNTTIRSLTIVLLLICTTAIYSQGSFSLTEEAKKDGDYLIKDLSIREIQKAVYEIPAYYETKEYIVTNILVMRDSAEMKKVATTPPLYIDSLFYENITNIYQLDIQKLLLERFPYLLMVRLHRADKIQEIMDSIAVENPFVTKEEYWAILKTHPEVININFENLNKEESSIVPFQKIADIRMARVILLNQAMLFMGKPSIETKPYLEKLGALPPDTTFFNFPRRQIIRTVEDSLFIVKEE